MRLAADPNATPAPQAVPLPPDLPKAIAAIVKALALPPDADDATIKSALDALLTASHPDQAPSQEVIETSGFMLGLSASEISACKAQRCTPEQFIAAKRALR